MRWRRETAKFINSYYKKNGVQPKTETWLKQYHEFLKIDAKKHKEPIPPFPSPDDHCVYIDTDSVYFSAKPLIKDGENEKDVTINLARKLESDVNKFYDTLAKMLFNCDKHRFVIKGESIMETGFWVAKKRYAMKVVYDLETNTDKDGKKPKVKGLDVVRSSFPPAFAKFMTELLIAILNKKSKEEIDEMVLVFHDKIQTMDYLAIARSTAVNKVSPFDDVSELNFVDFPKGAPVQSKAAVTYNRFIRKLELDNKYPLIRDGDKVKYVYLKKNPYGIRVMAIKTYDDPPQVLDLVKKYVDPNKIFEKELANKLQYFYEALSWGSLLPTQINQKAKEFFSF